MYSALTTLRSLPVQIVKIDKSFVAGSTVNAEDRAVTEAVVKMAAQMGMRTIAEGVERLDQQDFLSSIGTDAVQGFLYLRPTTAGEFGTWLETHLAGLPHTRPTGGRRHPVHAAAIGLTPVTSRGRQTLRPAPAGGRSTSCQPPGAARATSPRRDRASRRRPPRRSHRAGA